MYEAGEVRLIDLAAVAAGAATPELAMQATPAAMALFDDELWLVDADGPVLRRFDRSLDEIDHVALPAGRGLLRASFGAPSAVWSSEPACVIAQGVGALTIRPIEGLVRGATVVAALSPQRLVVERAGAIAMVDGGHERWHHALERGQRVLALSPIFDGRAVAALIGRPGAAAEDPDRHLLVLSCRDGRVDHRLAVRGIDTASFASRRGLAVLVAGQDSVVFADLRFGRVLGQARLEEHTHAVSIDDDGTHLILNTDNRRQRAEAGAPRARDPLGVPRGRQARRDRSARMNR